MALVAGTGVGNPHLVPGIGLHHERMLLTQAGLTPAEALRTATVNAARSLGATDFLGVVAPGKLADLVLLDADPLEARVERPPGMPELLITRLFTGTAMV